MSSIAYVSLLFDGMKIKSDLIFSQSERLVGFTNFSDIKNELDDFNRFIKKKKKNRPSYPCVNLDGSWIIQVFQLPSWLLYIIMI